MNTRVSFLAPAILALTAIACGKSTDSGSNAVNPAMQAEADKIYVQRCSICHGMNGAGDGPGTADLDPKPRNLQETAWQSSVNDAYIEQIIKLGGKSVGKSPSMPPNPDLETNEPLLKALRAKVRTLKR